MTLKQKRDHAASCVRKLNIPFVAAVDGLDNAVERAYAGWPSRIYLLDKQAHVVFNSPLDEFSFDAAALDSALALPLRQ